MTIVDYFNPYSIDHIWAYNYLSSYGSWPVDFWEEIKDLDFDPLWHFKLMQKISNCWCEAIKNDRVFGMPPYCENKYDYIK